MTKKRTQLTLFIDRQQSTSIEKTRSAYNPLQYALIDSHVTLCREDELVPLDQVLLNLENLNHAAIQVDFEGVIRFSNGNGVLIPAVGLNEAFQGLRVSVLSGIIEKPRFHEPHITLMHPRNSICTDTIFEEIEQCTFPRMITFRKISLIEQKLGMKWRVLEEFDLL